MSTLAFPILWKDVHERGISGVIELHMSDLPLKGARVGDLFPVLNTKINAMFPFESNLREVESFLLYGKRVSRGRTLEPLIPNVSDDSLLTELEFSHDGPNGVGHTKDSTLKEDARMPHEMIIHPKRFEAFNLIKDDGIQCPMCFAKGVQERDGYTIISQWKDACGHKYHRFNAGKNYGSAEWESLLIVAKPREGPTAVKLSPTAQSAGLNKTDKCTICWSEFGSTASVFIVTVGVGTVSTVLALTSGLDGVPRVIPSQAALCAAEKCKHLAAPY
ncbi:hypothetical protein GQ600_22818 [Phytophthora cactorum]|nr:hypothetical protein GQ600_22818 [Phytophthora cactorum]